MSTTAKPRLTRHQERAVAVEARVDPRTVRRFLAGSPTRDLQQDLIEKALRKLGLVKSDAEEGNHG